MPPSHPLSARRTTALPAAVLLALILLVAPPQAAAQFTLDGDTPAPPRPPNILVLIADDLGIEGVGAYGPIAAPPYTPRTPYLDLLAQHGTLFRNCWSNPGCSPTRATLLTGRYSFRTGIGQAINYQFSPFELPLDQPSIPRQLSNGTRSAALGKWHLATQNGTGRRHPGLMGFDVFRGSMKILPGFISDAYYSWEKVVDGKASISTKYTTTDTVDDALEFIDETTDPWFLWVAFHAPHSPFHKPPADLHSFDLPPKVSDDVALHMLAMTEAMDREIGRLLMSLDPEVRDNTIVVFIGDNGAPASVTVPPLDPQHAKNTVYEGGLRVPLIVAGPGVMRGVECNGLVNSTDVFATVLDISHSQLPGNAPAPPKDSVTLTPYFTDPHRSSLRPWIYAEYFKPNGINPSVIRRAMRGWRYKLIQSLHPTAGVLDEEFYDLLADPLETTNLLDFQALPTSITDELTRLRDELQLLDPAAPWSDLDGSLPGMKTAPSLSGSGIPAPGSVVSLNLNHAPADTLGLLIAGATTDQTTYAAGVLTPHSAHTVPVRTDALGQLSLSAVWPEDAPRADALVFQVVFPTERPRRGSNTLQLSLR